MWWLQLMNAMVPDDEQDGSKTVHSWFYTKILLTEAKSVSLNDSYT